MNGAGADDVEGVSAFEAYVHRAFAPDGLFSRARDFEYRAEQQNMALAVARALQVDAPLLVEAGTGVGKSLGYLLPAVKFALDFDRPEFRKSLNRQGGSHIPIERYNETRRL